MKYSTLFICTLFFLFAACSSNEKGDGSSPKSDQPKEISVFSNLGCCTDIEKRKTEDCCCKEVAAAYKKILADDDLEKIKNVMTTDPVLGDCRQHLKYRPIILETEEAAME